MPNPILQMDRKEFDARAGTLRFDLSELWKLQSIKNDVSARQIAELQALVAELVYRIDTLTLSVSGGVNEAKNELSIPRGKE